MIQQNDVLHWQCSEDTPFMLQLLFNHLHLEHLSSLYLYSTQDLHRAFLLSLTVSSFFSHLIPSPQPPSSFTFFLCPTQCSFWSSSLSPSIWFLGQCYIVVTVLVLSQDVPNHFPSCLCNSSLSAFIPALLSNSPFVTWSCHQICRKGNFICQLRYIIMHVSHAPQ